MIDFNPNFSIIVIFVILFIMLFFIYKYYYSTINNKSYLVRSLVFLRLISLFLLFLILINPIIIKNTKINNSFGITYLIDNSKSLSFSLDKDDLISNLNEFNDILDEKTIKYEYYLFGDRLRKISSVSQINFQDSSTDLNDLLNNINLFNNNRILLISDGLQNKGMLNLSNFYKKNIYTFGIGNQNNQFENISLDSLKIIKSTSDSIFFKSKISTSIYNDYEDVEIFLSNSKNNKLNVSSFSPNRKNNNFFHDFSISKEYLLENNILHLNKIPNEINLNDNYINLSISEVELKKMNLILLSGRLSSNTSYIKQILNNYNNIKLNHIFLFDNIDNIISTIDKESILIFDSFPIKKSHLDLINKYNLIDNYKFIFFQGPTLKDDIKYLNKFSLDFSYNFTFDENISDNQYFHSSNHNNNINNRMLEKIAPINISTSVKTINTTDVQTNHKNTLIDLNKNLFFFIEDMKSISSETNKIYKYNNFDYLINYFIKKFIYSNDSNSIGIYTNKSNYYVNEKFNIYIDLSSFKESDFKQINLFLLNSNGDLITRIDEYEILNDNNLVFQLSCDSENEYFIYAQLHIDSTISVQTSNLIIEVNQNDNEIMYAYLNKDNLMDISLKSGGEYYGYSQLKDYVNTLQSNSSIMLKLLRYNVFNFQFFWFVIILFLIVEWFIRKNKGLL